LTAAISILSTNEFNYKGKIINGCKKHPDDILSLLRELSSDICISNESQLEKGSVYNG
jgi:hypothetical protein